MALHAGGKGAKYTRAHPPAALAGLWRCGGRTAAARLEYAFKTLTRTRKLALLAAPERVVEVLPALAGCDYAPVRGMTLERLMEEIPQKKCVAFGSNRNDLSMLTSAQLSYATADAEAEAKAAAKRQLKGHGGDSIVRKIFRLYERLPWEKLPKEMKEPKE